MRKSKQVQWSRIERDWVALKEEKVFVTSVKEKASVRRETNVVSGMRVMIVQNRHQKPHPPLSHQWHELEARREKEGSWAEVRLAEFFDNRADTVWNVLVRDHLVSIGISNVNSVKLNRDASSAQSAHSRTGRLKNNQTKSRKRVTTKVQLQLRKVHDSWAVYQKTLSRQIRQRFLGRAQKCWNQFDEYDSRGLHCVKQTSEKMKVRPLVKYKSKFLISEVPTLWNLRTDLQKRLQGKSNVPAEMRGNLPTNFISSKGRQSYILFAFWEVDLCRPHPQ